MARDKSRRKRKQMLGKNRRSQVATPKASFLRHVLKTLPLMLLAVLFTFVLNRTGLFKELETSFLDAKMKIAVPSQESSVVIVDIMPEDFEQKFKGQTWTLDPIALQKLSEALAAGQPCVVGMDVDTSFDHFKDFDVTKLSNFVWSRSATISADEAQTTLPLKVLGRQDPSLDEKSGIPILEDDEKGVTRFYSRLIKTAQGDLPSFGWAIIKESKRRNCEGINFQNLKETTDPLIINYSKAESRARIPAANILKFAENNWQGNDLIKNKIVLLGGSYMQEDKSQTPLGMMNGVEIHANVVESELLGKGIKPPSFLSVILLQVFDGFLLIVMFQIFPWRKAILISIPFIIGLSLACSFLTYGSLSHWAFFVPVMIGVALTELFEETKEHFKNRYKREIGEVYEGLGSQSEDAKDTTHEG